MQMLLSLNSTAGNATQRENEVIKKQRQLFVRTLGPKRTNTSYFLSNRCSNEQYVDVISKSRNTAQQPSWNKELPSSNYEYEFHAPHSSNIKFLLNLQYLSLYHFIHSIDVIYHNSQSCLSLIAFDHPFHHSSHPVPLTNIPQTHCLHGVVVSTPVYES